MNGTALLLVLTGAVCHASWNIVAKKAGGGLPFVWLFGLVSVVAAIPVTVWAWMDFPQIFTAPMWLAVVASALIHIFYSLVLQKGYRESDFAVVYPVARGTGPMLAVVAAVVLLGEKPSAMGCLSVAAILLGVFTTAGITSIWLGKSLQKKRHLGVMWGVATGAFIASYTVIDGWAIKSLAMSPILFYTAGLFLRAVLLAPFALRRPAELRGQWREHRAAVIAVGILSPLAYCLVLFAVQRAPLSYVAPVREISMLFGTFIGAGLLRESLKASQIAGAAIMLAGVLGLAWA